MSDSIWRNNGWCVDLCITLWFSSNSIHDQATDTLEIALFKAPTCSEASLGRKVTPGVWVGFGGRPRVFLAPSSASTLSEATNAKNSGITKQGSEKTGGCIPSHQRQKPYVCGAAAAPPVFSATGVSGSAPEASGVAPRSGFRLLRVWSRLDMRGVTSSATFRSGSSGRSSFSASAEARCTAAAFRRFFIGMNSCSNPCVENQCAGPFDRH